MMYACKLLTNIFLINILFMNILQHCKQMLHVNLYVFQCVLFDVYIV